MCSADQKHANNNRLKLHNAKVTEEINKDGSTVERFKQFFVIICRANRQKD